MRIFNVAPHRLLRISLTNGHCGTRIVQILHVGIAAMCGVAGCCCPWDLAGFTPGGHIGCNGCVWAIRPPWGSWQSGALRTAGTFNGTQSPICVLMIVTRSVETMTGHAKAVGRNWKMSYVPDMARRVCAIELHPKICGMRGCRLL